MNLSVNTNATAMRTGTSLADSTRRMQRSMERLSTGQKINRAADDASGLVISEFQRAQIVGLEQGIANIERANDLLQTAESGLGEIGSLLLRIRTLAVDAANNGAMDSDALAASQAEINNLLSTVDRVALTTKFGTKHLLDGTFSNGSATSGTTEAVSTQLEHQHGGVIDESALIPEGESRVIIDEHHADPGHAGSPNTHFFAETGDEHHYAWQDQDVSTPGVIDLYYDFRDEGIFTNNITAAQQARIVDAFNLWSAATGGVLQFIQNTTAARADIINVGTGDLAATGGTSGPGGVLAQGGGVFTHGTSHTITSGIMWMDQAETWDTVIGNGNPPGTFDYFSVAAHELGHALGLGHTNDIPGTTIMNGTYSGEQTALSASDVEHIQVLYGSVSGSGSALAAPEGGTFQIGAFDGEAVTFALLNARASELGKGVTGSAYINLGQINVETFEGASDSIRVVDKAIEDVTTERGRIGAFQKNTLGAVQNMLRAELQDLQIAESTVRDTDYTTEIARFTNEQIRQQAATTVLGLANQQPQAILSLLQS